MAEPRTYRDRITGRLGSPDASPRALAADVLARLPGWFRGAMWLRDRMVRRLGLKTATGLPGGTSPLEALTTYRDDAAAFSAGLEDRHLDFRVTLRKEPGGRFALSTWVLPHNALGHAYLACVLPVHRIAMRDFARRLARPIGEEPA